MEQTIVIGSLVVVAVLGLLFYPRLMFALVGVLLRGIVSLLADSVALLLAWI